MSPQRERPCSVGDGDYAEGLSGMRRKPWIWKEKAADFRTGQPEFYFSNIYHLPVDQRYDEEDMHHLAEIVLRLVKESASGNRT